jgi:hypothetical protein
MPYKSINNINVYKEDDLLRLSFTMSSKGDERESTQEVFAELAQSAEVENIKSSKGENWHFFPKENLAFFMQNGKVVFTEVATDKSIKTLSSLLLVPIILLEKEIISEEHKNIFWEVLNLNPLIKKKTTDKNKEAFKDFLAQSYEKSPLKSNSKSRPKS